MCANATAVGGSAVHRTWTATTSRGASPTGREWQACSGRKVAAPARSLAHAALFTSSDAARHRAFDAVVFGLPLSTVGWLPCERLTMKTAVVLSYSSWSQCINKYGSGRERRRNVSSALDTCGRAPAPPARAPCSRSSSRFSWFSTTSVCRVSSRRAAAAAGGGASSYCWSHHPSGGSTSKPAGSASSSDVLHSTGECRRAICRPMVL